VEALCVVDGIGLHRAGEADDEPLAPGAVVVMLPGEVHGLRGTSVAPPLTLINVAIPVPRWRDIAAVADLDAGFDGRTAAVLRVPGAVGLFRALLASAPDRQEPRHLVRFVLGLSEGLAASAPEEDSSWAARIAWAAGRDEVLHEGLQALLAVLSLSYSHLARLCRNELDATPTEVVNRARIERARHLLTTTSLPVTDVAARCGFDTLSRFYAVFGRETGRAPGVFRAEQLSGLATARRSRR